MGVGVARAAPAKDKITAYGLDAVCEDIINGKTLTDIAKSIGVDISTLIAWREADPQRSARTRDARTKSAQIWDEKAIEELRAAHDPISLGVAREIAFHYRWRSSKIAPGEYGDRQKQEHQMLDKDGNPTAPAVPAVVVNIHKDGGVK